MLLSTVAGPGVEAETSQSHRSYAHPMNHYATQRAQGLFQPPTGGRNFSPSVCQRRINKAAHVCCLQQKKNEIFIWLKNNSNLYDIIQNVSNRARWSENSEVSNAGHPKTQTTKN